MRLLRRKPSAPTAPAPTAPAHDATTSRACSALDAMPLPYSDLIGEMMAIYCHTRPIGALSQDINCPEEYRMVASSIIHHILEGWWNQTDGQGTINDLLLEPAAFRTVRDVSSRRDRAEPPWVTQEYVRNV
jgi:hypothetical protein